MAREIYRFACTVPAGTPKTAPAVLALTMPPRIVDEVQVVVPSGTHGLVGFALGAAGVPVIPINAGQFFTTDDEKISWSLEGQIDSGAWQLFGFNAGQYDHTLEVRFLCRLISDQAVAPTGLLDPATLSQLPLDSSAAQPPEIGVAAEPVTLSPTQSPAPASPASPLPAAPAPGPSNQRQVQPPIAPTLATVGFRRP